MLLPPLGRVFLGASILASVSLAPRSAFGQTSAADSTVRRAPAADSARADTAVADTSRAHRRFYRGLPYGTESQFNPFSVNVYEGFDQLRTSPRQNIFKYPFGSSYAAVFRSIIRPDKPIRRYGVRNWLRNEIFPLTLKGQGGGQWYPNYTLHLFGGGLTYARLEDWYYQHGFQDHPRLLAAITTFNYYYLNEVMENGPTADLGVDALSDLLVFDVASIVVWTQGPVRRLFSEHGVEASTWPGQASFGLPGQTIENAYSMFMLRVPLPLTSNWKVLVTQGATFTGGLSRRLSSSDWFTVAAGYDVPANPIIDPVTFKKTATFEPNAALYWDRNGSLLVALIGRLGSNNGATLNVYPGVLNVGRFRPGVWLQQDRSGGVRFGLSSTLGFGLSSAAGVRR